MNARVTGSTFRTSKRWSRSRSADVPSPGWWKAKSRSTSCFAFRPISATIRKSSGGSRSTLPDRTASRGCEFPFKQLVVRIDPHKPGATYIYRENNRRYIPIKFSVKGRDLASTILEAQRKVTDSKNRGAASTGIRHRLGGRV